MKLQMAGLVLGFALFGSGCGDEDKKTTDLTPMVSACAPATQITGGSFSTEELDAGPDFMSRTAVALAADGSIHVVYNVATTGNDGVTGNWNTPGIWYTTNKSGSWTKTLLVPAEGVSREFPTIAIAPDATVAVIYSSNVAETNQSDLYLLTDRGSGFSAPTNITHSSPIDTQPLMAYDAQGLLHVIYQEIHDSSTYKIGYLQISAAGAVAHAVAQDTTIDYGMAIAPDGTVHLAYMRGDSTSGNSVLWHRYRDPTTGLWSASERITAVSTSSWMPTLAAGCDGSVHLAYVAGDADTDRLTYMKRTAGVWSAPQELTSGTTDRTSFVGIQTNDAGTVQIAFYRNGEVWADVLAIRGKDGVFDAEVALTTDPDIEESTPAVALAPDGTAVVAYPALGPELPASAVKVATWK